MFVFINHSKKAIEYTDKCPNKDIPKCLLGVMKSNKWSIEDTIELCDIYYDKYKLRDLVEKENYICDKECSKWFYF